jgi:nitrite reductase/ring-hydroxylating ferredoxin subunit
MGFVKAIEEAGFTGRASLRIEGSPVALFRVGEEIFALDDVCSHEYSLLSEGDIEEGSVVCAKHGSRFDLRTGEVEGFPATKGVAVWDVKTEDGWIWLSRRTKT